MFWRGGEHAGEARRPSTKRRRRQQRQVRRQERERCQRSQSEHVPHQCRSLTDRQCARPSVASPEVRVKETRQRRQQRLREVCSMSGRDDVAMGGEAETIEIRVARRIFVGNLSWQTSWQVGWHAPGTGAGPLAAACQAPRHPMQAACCRPCARGVRETHSPGSPCPPTPGHAGPKRPLQRGGAGALC